jgi:hypothetical protein
VSEAKFELHAVVDEDGFVALVCPDTYSGYVSEDWTLDQVLATFVEQMNTGALFAVYPGPDLADASLRISDTPSTAAARREVSGLIRVGEGGLWLTDYTQLTMAAQFSDTAPYAAHHVRLPTPSGVYHVTLRQFASLYEDELEPAVELVIRRSEIGAICPQFDAVPWFG